MGVRQNIKNSIAQAVIGGKNFSLKQKNGYDIYRNDFDTVNIQNDVSIKDLLVDNSVEQVNFKGKVFNRKVDGVQVVYNRESGVLELISTITGSAIYDPLTKRITYSVTLGNVSSWSYQSINQRTAEDTGEISVSSGSTSEGAVLGIPQDGVWNVTFKGYNASGDLKATAGTTLTVASPVPPAEEVYNSSGFKRNIFGSQSLGVIGDPLPLTLEANYNGNVYRWACEFGIIDIPVNQQFNGVAIESAAAGGQHKSIDPETGVDANDLYHDYQDGFYYTTASVINPSQVGKSKYKGYPHGRVWQYAAGEGTNWHVYHKRVTDPDDIGWKHHWNEPEFWNLPQLWNEPYIDEYGAERKTAKVGLLYGCMNEADNTFLGTYNGMTVKDGNGVVSDADNLYAHHSYSAWNQGAWGVGGPTPIVGFWERVGNDLLITPSSPFAWNDGRHYSLPLGLAGLRAWCALGVPVLDGDTSPGSVYDWVKTYYNTPEPPEPPPASYYRANGLYYGYTHNADLIVSNGDQIQIAQTMSAVVPERRSSSGSIIFEPERPGETFNLGVDAIEIQISSTYPYSGYETDGAIYTIQIGPNTTQGATALSGSQSSFNSLYYEPGQAVTSKVANYQISWDLTAGTVTVQGLNDLGLQIRIYRAPVPPAPVRSPAFNEWVRLDTNYPHPDVAGSLNYDTQAQAHHRIPGWFAATEGQQREMASTITEADIGLSWRAYKQTPEERIYDGWYSIMSQTVRRQWPASGDNYTATRRVRRAWPSYM